MSESELHQNPIYSKFELELQDTIDKEDFKKLNGLLTKGKEEGLSPSEGFKTEVAAKVKRKVKSGTQKAKQLIIDIS